MNEPIILGYPITQLILFFFFYSFLGWVMETCYCSILEHKLVPRGFLYGPICPIYGVGVLLMILFFKPLTGNLLVFYVTAVVVMSAWEYLVGWLLEITTHTKYWDYSHFRFNLHGRICLPIALVWGGLSYIVIFWIHPYTELLFSHIALWLSNVLCGVAIGILICDATLTIHQLALVARLTASVSAASEALQLQLALGKAELDSAVADLSFRYREQINRLERHTRRLRKQYTQMSFQPKYKIRIEDLKAAADLAREELLNARAARKAERAAKKQQRSAKNH